MSPASEPRSARPRRRLLVLLAPVLFFALAGGLFFALYRGDASIIPSALVGRPAPAFSLEALPGADVPGLSDADLAKGRVSLVNIWASWCAPCRTEHPVLMRIAEELDVDLHGIAYKDRPENAARFLSELGNPFQRIGLDPSGRIGIEWGVYGVPETYVVDGDGIVRHRHVGPLSPADVENVLKPEIDKARKGLTPAG